MILAVDDDAEVLRSVSRDLRRKYGQEFRIVSADSGEAARESLEEWQGRGEELALIVADQRMPGMQGVELLTQVRTLFPRAKRVLLTAYADTNAAIAAINSAKIDFYLTKPWDPPEQHLYPVLDDLLSDWRHGYRPPYEGLRLIGYRWTPETHRLKDFLGRNLVPFQWLDAEAEEADPEIAKLLESLRAEQVHLPAVLFADGTRMEAPEPEAVAARLGLQTQAKTSFYDLIIIGGGPAGLAAGVYAASEGLKTVIVEREAPGGQAGQSSRIENYLGFPAGLTGADLARRAVTQCARFGAELLTPQEAVKLTVDGAYRTVEMRDGTQVTSHTILIATGLSWRLLDAPGADRLQGAGVYYGAALTEAVACSNEEVFVVGGANSAGQGALHFAHFARKVTMLVRAESLTQGMSQYLVDQIEATPAIQVLTAVEVAEAHGAGRLEALTLRNRRTGERWDVPATSLFIFIGAAPCTSWLRDVLPMDDRGYILAGPVLRRAEHWRLDREPYLLETGIPGVFTAGDTRHGSVKRVASAVGEGSICIQMVHQYLSKVR
ncbi:MAG: FAD-dependent oxidoreductase [Bryobacteraceae bacterium]|nr:FAD-dependent oxidoreductase [Bryobacteraceae bacterium]